MHMLKNTDTFMSRNYVAIPNSIFTTYIVATYDIMCMLYYYRYYDEI